MKRKGDTLIEVALAIGVFSLVAITVVSVVSASLTNAQAALEVTLTREELDAQAEALRFIHESYITGTQAAIRDDDNPYYGLWKKITEHAVDLSTASQTNKEKVLKFNPTTCSTLYNTTNYLVNKPLSGAIPFIINTRQLSSLSFNNVIISEETSKKVFYPASPYPRILYKDQTSDDLDTQSKYTGTTIQRVEGIFIIAVKDKEKVVSGTDVIDRTAYYDFYIRSCWMPLNSDRAATISTVVRLYDPAVITY